MENFIETKIKRNGLIISPSLKLLNEADSIIGSYFILDGGRVTITFKNNNLKIKAGELRISLPVIFSKELFLKLSPIAKSKAMRALKELNMNLPKIIALSKLHGKLLWVNNEIKSKAIFSNPLNINHFAKHGIELRTLFL